MPGKRPEGKERSPYKFSTTYARREQLRKAVIANPSIATYGELLVAMFEGKDIVLPPLNPKHSTRAVTIHFFLEDSAEEAIMATAFEQNMTFPAFVHLLLFKEEKVRKNAAKSKAPKVISFQLDADEFAAFSYGVTREFGPHASMHQSAKALLMEQVTAVIESDAEKLADNIIKDS
jgi:hypothetical protein